MASSNTGSERQQKQPLCYDNPLECQHRPALDCQKKFGTNPKDGDGDDSDVDDDDSSSEARFSSEIFDLAATGNLEALKQRLTNSDSDSVSSASISLTYLRGKKSSTPLHYAAGNGHLEVCRFLLQKVSTEAEAKTKTKDSSPNGKSRALESGGASSYANCSNQTQGRTALHWAARNGHLAICKLLVREFGADPDPLAKGGVTPLQLAVWRGHLGVCLWLSEAGSADKYFVNGWGCTVHHWLAKSPIYSEQQTERNRNRKQQQQKESSQNGIRANLHRGDDSDPAAATVDDDDAETRLLALCEWLDDDEPGPSEDAHDGSTSAWNRPNDHGQTPLHKAGFGGNLPVLRFLIKRKGCCDTHRDSQHNTSADCAERNQQWEAARYLRRHGNPGCLQRARAVLFQGVVSGTTATTTTSASASAKSTVNEPPPTLSAIRASYKELARVYHPDRKNRPNKDACENHGSSSSEDIPATNDVNESRWKDLQDAYRLWTLWWKEPGEADALIRSLERHQFLQRQLPLLVLWHKEWHESEGQGISNPRNCNTSGHDRNNFDSRVEDTTSITNHIETTTKTTVSASRRANPRKPKKQKVGGGNVHGSDNDNRTPPRINFSQEAIQKLEDFERRLVRLLGTLPSQEIPLSQLPKEYEKTWGSSSGGGGGGGGGGETMMIRPKDYRCKKLGFLLQKHCSRTVEVVPKPAATSGKEKTAAAMWVRLKGS